MTYRYTDHKTDLVVFECTAANILAADELYCQAIGTDVVRQVHVGCEIIP